MDKLIENGGGQTAKQKRLRPVDILWGPWIPSTSTEMVIYEAGVCVNKLRNLLFLTVSETDTGVWLKDIISRGFGRSLRLPFLDKV